MKGLLQCLQVTWRYLPHCKLHEARPRGTLVFYLLLEASPLLPPLPDWNRSVVNTDPIKPHLGDVKRDHG